MPRRCRFIDNLVMSMGPSLIFDKSALESLNIDEAVMMDNFYMSTITPLFFVECLADLEKAIKSKSTPEQLVGSLADRSPDLQGYPNVHHMDVLTSELQGYFKMNETDGRVAMAGGRAVQLDGKTGFVYKESDEAMAFRRWSRREFLEVERQIARRWRRSLTGIDIEKMVTHVSEQVGPWRMPKSFADAKQLADAMIDNLNPEFLLRFGLDLLAMPEPTAIVVHEWIQNRRPNLRQYLPYFVFMLTINLFFCLALPAKLFSNVKQSHMIDLAYLYYLPFCSVFVSQDNFHKQTVPLFLGPMQDFVNGVDFKEDMRKLANYFLSLPEEVRQRGTFAYASFPPLDDSLITVRLWDKYLPKWRDLASTPRTKSDPAENEKLLAEIKRMSESPDLQPADIPSIDAANYVSLQRAINPRKGRFQRMSDDQIRRSIEHQNKK